MLLRIDIERAKEAKREGWRKERAPLLEYYDSLYFKILEDKNAPEEILSAIGKIKQELRDVTKSDMSHINNIEELKAFRPACLERKRING